MSLINLTAVAGVAGVLLAADWPIIMQFKAVVGLEELASGRCYSGIGTTKSSINRVISASPLQTSV